MRRPLLLALVLFAAGCAGGGGDGAGGGTGGAPSTAAPSGSTGTIVSGDDERTYVVARADETLALDDVDVRLVAFRWRRHAPVATPPPGTRAYAEARVRLTNRGDRAERIRPTQIWLVDDAGNTSLAAAGAPADGRLVGRRVGPGETVAGTLLFPVAARAPGSLLVYRFADAGAIAAATRAGLIRHP